MQYHWIAFAPFAVLAGTALGIGGVSGIINLMSHKAKMPMVPKRSAEIIYFPAAKSRLVRPASVTRGEAGRGTAA